MLITISVVFCHIYWQFFCQTATCWSDVTQSAAGVFIVSTKMICFGNITSNDPRYILCYFNSRGSFVPQGYYGPGCTFNTWRWCNLFASSLGPMSGESTQTVETNIQIIHYDEFFFKKMQFSESLSSLGWKLKWGRVFFLCDSWDLKEKYLATTTWYFVFLFFKMKLQTKFK